MEVAENTGVSDQGFLSTECRLLDRYELQTELVETLTETREHKHLAAKCAACHRSFRHWRCEFNHDWAEAENSCSQRVCPHCSRRRSLILAERFTKATVGRDGLRYAVLAEENCMNLKAGIASLWKAWTSLRRSVRWKGKVKGCVVALEVTYNPICTCGKRKRAHNNPDHPIPCKEFARALKHGEDSAWHPHLNVLLEGEYFPFEELNRAWMKATKGKGRTSHISAADAGTVRELIKYVTKISDLIGDPLALDEFLTAVSNVRIVRTYGTFFGLNVEDEENPGIECPDCGTHTMVKLGHVHPSQVTFDFEKEVFRVSRSPGRVEFDLHNAEGFNPDSFALDNRKPFASAGAWQWERRVRKLQGRLKAEALRLACMDYGRFARQMPLWIARVS